MMQTNSKILKQLKQNTVALLSLLLVTITLVYSTWRNERTEANRNKRVAAFKIILKINDLQQLIFHHHYDKDVEDKGNPRTGWSYVLSIQDLAYVLTEAEQNAATDLKDEWENSWSHLSDKDGLSRIMDEMDQMRTSIKSLLNSLD